MLQSVWQRHAWRNRLQTLLLIFTLFGIAALAGFLLFGKEGLLMALVASGVALMLEPAAAAGLTLRLYRARPIAFDEAPELWNLMQKIARNAGLPVRPTLHYAPSNVVSAFTVGSARHAAIVMTDGLLRTLNMREIAGVLAHETAHIVHGDLRVMNLADYVGRLTALFALVGQMSLLILLPLLLKGRAAINWIGLMLLAISPHLALIAQMGLSRVREFDADLEAARLTGHPVGILAATGIERSGRHDMLHCLPCHRSHKWFVFTNGIVRAMLWSMKCFVGYVVAVTCLFMEAHGAADDELPSILVYHRFGPTVADSMTVRTAAFAAQLEFLKENGYTVVPLRKVVDRIHGSEERLPHKAVAITVDDGHRSVYTEMLPLVRRHNIPVTLFIYPSAISNASYALTWRQLEELRQSGLFDIQSHTYWHPNFRQEKRRLPAAAFRDFVRMQLVKPRQILAQRLGVTADLLAWPFGIYDDELIAEAGAAGYAAGFTLDRRRPNMADRPLALPRFLITDGIGIQEFQRLLGESAKQWHRRS